MNARRPALLIAIALTTLAAACTDPNDPGNGTTTTASPTSSSSTSSTSSTSTSSTTVPTPPQGVTRLASGGVASAAVISRNGRYVAYVSTSPTPGVDANGGETDVFLIDRQASTTTRVSGGNGASDSPSVADDGSVVFRSASSDLGGPGDTNGHVDAFRWTTAGVTRITDSPADVVSPLVSADGTSVVFGGPEALTVSGGSNRTQTFMWHAATPGSLTLLAAVGPDGSVPLSVTTNGDRVLLGEPGRLSVHDGASATQIAAAPASPPAPQVSTFAVAPHALADDGDAAFAEVTYSYDSGTGVVSFVSGTARRWDRQTAAVSTLGLSGVPAGPVLSADGRHAVYADMTAVAVDQDDVGTFLRGAIRSYDTTLDTTVTVAGAAQASFGTVSADGRYVAFVSTDTTLAPADPTPTLPDVYLWDRGP